MDTTNIVIKQRPLRIGLLVRPGQLADLRKAAGICTLLWGGIRNPIIPIDSESDQTAKGFLDLFQIDVLYPVDAVAKATTVNRRPPASWSF